MILRGMDNDSKKLVLELVYDWQYEQDRLCRLKYESVWAPLSLWCLMRMSHWSHMVLLVTGNDTLLKQHVSNLVVLFDAPAVIGVNPTSVHGLSMVLLRRFLHPIH